MHVISRKRLQEFWTRHPQAREPLLAWYRIVAASSFAALRQTFPAADVVQHWVVFNVAGNNVRLVAAIKFDRRQKVYVRHVFTHAEYDLWNDNRRDDEAKAYRIALPRRRAVAKKKAASKARGSGQARRPRGGGG